MRSIWFSKKSAYSLLLLTHPPNSKNPSKLHSALSLFLMASKKILFQFLKIFFQIGPLYVKVITNNSTENPINCHLSQIHKKILKIRS